MKNLTDKDLLLEFQHETGKTIWTENELQDLKRNMKYVEWLEEQLLKYRNLEIYIDSIKADLITEEQEEERIEDINYQFSCESEDKCDCGGCDCE
jgi:hypothetical protein